jgi:hypothetical protein
MGRETYFPRGLCHNAKVVHAFEANTPFEKLPGTQINLPRLNLHKRPRHRRCPTSRDFVRWRFSDAGRRSAWIASSCRHPKTCTGTDIDRRVRRRGRASWLIAAVVFDADCR